MKVETNFCCETDGKTAPASFPPPLKSKASPGDPVAIANITVQIHTSCISLLWIELLKSIEIHWNPLKSIEIWSSLHLTSKPHPKKPWNRRTGARCYQRIAHTAEQDPCGIMGIWPALKTWVCLNKVWSMSNRFLRKSCYPCKICQFGGSILDKPTTEPLNIPKRSAKRLKGIETVQDPWVIPWCPLPYQCLPHCTLLCLRLNKPQSYKPMGETVRVVVVWCLQCSSSDYKAPYSRCKTNQTTKQTNFRWFTGAIMGKQTS